MDLLHTLYAMPGESQSPQNCKGKASGSDTTTVPNPATAGKLLLQEMNEEPKKAWTPEKRLKSKTSHQVSLQCPITAQYPCSDRQQPTSRSLQCPWQRILAVPKPTVSLQCPCIPAACPNPQYLCSAQWQSPALAMPNPTAFAPAVPKCNIHQYSRSAFAALQGRQFRGAGAGKQYISCAITASGWGCS